MKSLYDYNGNDLKLFAYVTPEMFGAVGNGVMDDSGAIQQALNCQGLVIFATNKTYLINTVLRVKNNTVIDLNGSTIIGTTGHNFYNFESSDTYTGYSGNGNIVIQNGTVIGGCTSFAHGKNIRLENVHFINATESHFLEIAGCQNYVIEGCSFSGMVETTASVKEYINIDPVTHPAFPWLPDGSTFFDGIKNDGIKVNGCYFDIGSDSTYAFGFNAVGVHGVTGVSSKHKNLVFTNNLISGFTGCGFRINDMDNVIIENNNITVGGDGIRVGDVAQSTNVLIKSNVISASGTAVTKENNSTVFQSADNDINPIFS